MAEFEIKRLNEAVATVNVSRLLPSKWRQQIDMVVKSFGRLVKLPGGKVSTSLEPSSFITVYKVVKGEDIEENLPWLTNLWQGPFREMASEVAGQEVVVDRDKKFGININNLSLDTQRDGYELHTDKNHWTVMLARDTMRKGDGGELIHVLSDGRRLATRIRAGWVYIFDGLNHPHKVELLNPEGRARTRTTVPMDYILKGSTVERTEDFNALFGNSMESVNLTNEAE